MKFLRLKFFELNNSDVKDIIINADKVTSIKKNYPDKLNPNSPYEILIELGVNYYRIPFKSKDESENYFNYVMEKLRAIILKPTPW